MFLSTTGDESCLLDIKMKIGIKPMRVYILEHILISPLFMLYILLVG